MIRKVKTNSDEEWRELRSHYIGGSDAAAVCGMNPWKSSYSLWAEKTGRTPPFEGNLATEVGTFLEEFVARKFSQETVKKVRNCRMSIFNDEYPWAIANIDREVVGEDAGLEIKTTGELNLKKFKNGEYPSQYYVQCVHYLAVTGKKRWYLAVLIGNKEFKIFTIERDEDEIAALMKLEKMFYECIKTNTEPYFDGSPSTSSTLSAVYPDSDGTSCDLAGFGSLLESRDQINSEIKALTEKRDEIDNQIKGFMGTSEKGETDRYKVSWKTAERKTLDTKAVSAIVDLTPFYKITSYRTFKITKR